MTKKTSPESSFHCGKVAIIGRPNAGKSTLLNALLETAVSGVSKRPQTTRRNIRGVLQEFDSKKEWKGQLVVVDTPGVNFKKGLLERSMFMAVEESLSDVDVILWVADSRSWKRDLNDIEFQKAGRDRVSSWLHDMIQKTTEAKWVLALSKTDLMEKGDLLPLMAKTQELLPQFATVVPISAELGLGNKNSNLKALLEVLKAEAPESQPVYDKETWTDLNDREMIKNFVREALFRQGREELPYETDCSIESYQEPEGTRKKPEVHANIWVSKNSLKPIVVGKGGSRIKEIGTAVRKRYQEITGEDIVLKLFVKVQEGWNKEPSKISELGYAT